MLRANVLAAERSHSDDTMVPVVFTGGKFGKAFHPNAVRGDCGERPRWVAFCQAALGPPRG
jgi:hypothetical protein